MSEIDLTETRAMARKAGRQVLGLHGDELVAFADTIVVVIEAIGMKLVGECAAATARAERAEAALARVRQACAARKAGDCTYIRINDVLGAVDAQRPAEGGPEPAKPCTFYEPGGCSGSCVGRYCAGNDGNLWTAADEGADGLPRDDAAEALARRFHETYERLAPSFGYRTREASAKPWDEVPKDNRNLMIAVCAELFPAALDAGQPDAPAPTRSGEEGR